MLVYEKGNRVWIQYMYVVQELPTGALCWYKRRFIFNKSQNRDHSKDPVDTMILG